MQFGHEPGHSSFQVIDRTVLRLDASPAVRRRRWTTAAKERIVAKGLEQVGNVSAVARLHGLTPQQVFTWRPAAVRREQQEGDGALGTVFAAVRVVGTPGIPDGSVEPVSGVVELTVGDVKLRIGPSVPASRVRELLRVVRSA